jgi:hypothetical protein
VERPIPDPKRFLVVTSLSTSNPVGGPAGAGLQLVEIFFYPGTGEVHITCAEEKDVSAYPCAAWVDNLLILPCILSQDDATAAAMTAIRALEHYADELKDALNPKRPLLLHKDQRDYDIHINLPTSDGWVRGMGVQEILLAVPKTLTWLPWQRSNMVGVAVAVGVLSLVLGQPLPDAFGFMGDMSLGGIINTGRTSLAVARAALDAGITRLYMSRGRADQLRALIRDKPELAKRLEIFHCGMLHFFLSSPSSSGVEESKGGDEGASMEEEPAVLDETREPGAAPASSMAPASQEQQQEEGKDDGADGGTLVETPEVEKEGGGDRGMLIEEETRDPGAAPASSVDSTPEEQQEPDQDDGADGGALMEETPELEEEGGGKRGRPIEEEPREPGAVPASSVGPIFQGQKEADKDGGADGGALMEETPELDEGGSGGSLIREEPREPGPASQQQQQHAGEDGGADGGTLTEATSELDEGGSGGGGLLIEEVEEEGHEPGAVPASDVTPPDNEEEEQDETIGRPRKRPRVGAVAATVGAVAFALALPRLWGLV